MAGRSGIGVLVTGFSRVGALKKHAPLVFSHKCGFTHLLLCPMQVKIRSSVSEILACWQKKKEKEEEETDVNQDPVAAPAG